MRVLVTGVRGFLGRSVAAALLREGHDVRGLVRAADDRPGDARNTTRDAPAIALVQGDITDPRSVATAAAGVDAVIHLAFDMRASPERAMHAAVDGTANLVEAMRPGTRLVLASSFSVYDWGRVGKRLSEDSPLLPPDDRAALWGAYAHAKRLQESIATARAGARGVGLTVLRPATIWGPGHPGLDHLGPGRDGLQFVVRPRRLAQLTHVEHCADAFVAALTDHSAHGVFNVEDGFAWPVRDYARRANPGARLVAVPAALTRGLATLGPLARTAFHRGLKLPGLLIPERFDARFPEARVDAARLREQLGWRPRLGPEEALRQAYDTAPSAATRTR